jgi:hypothetical protein
LAGCVSQSPPNRDTTEPTPREPACDSRSVDPRGRSVRATHPVGHQCRVEPTRWRGGDAVGGQRGAMRQGIGGARAWVAAYGGRRPPRWDWTPRSRGSYVAVQDVTRDRARVVSLLMWKFMARLPVIDVMRTAGRRW